MFTTALAADPAHTAVLLAQARQRCDSARERIEGAIADLRALDEGCVWKARAIDLLRARFDEQAEGLSRILAQLPSVESALWEG